MLRLMFYHPEHDLFPAGPTIMRPELAKLIDEILHLLRRRRHPKCLSFQVQANIDIN